MHDWRPNWYPVASLATLEEGRPAVSVAGHLTVTVHRYAGEIHVLRASCPHCDASLPEIHLTDTPPSIDCPGCRTRIESGEPGAALAMALPVMVVDEQVFAYVAEGGDER